MARSKAEQGAGKVSDRRYAPKAKIVMAIEAAKAASLPIGAIELGPNGTIRVLQTAPSMAGGSAYERWSEGRKLGKQAG